MFGDLLGKIVAAPLRIINIPIRVAEKVTGTEGAVSDTIREVADEADDAAREVLDD